MAWFRHREAAPARVAASSCEERQGSVSEVHPDMHRCALEALDPEHLLPMSAALGTSRAISVRSESGTAGQSSAWCAARSRASSACGGTFG